MAQSEPIGISTQGVHLVRPSDRRAECSEIVPCAPNDSRTGSSAAARSGNGCGRRLPQSGRCLVQKRRAAGAGAVDRRGLDRCPGRTATSLPKGAQAAESVGGADRKATARLGSGLPVPALQEGEARGAL